MITTYSQAKRLKGSWITNKLPPIGEKVECLLHHKPCEYYVKIGICSASEERYYTDIYYRKVDKNMSSGFTWTCGVGTPSATVKAWRPIQQQLPILF